MGSVEFDSVLAEIDSRVQERRARGDYPLGLEAQLEAEFDGVLKAIQRHEIGTQELEQRVSVVGERIVTADTPAELESRVPGGASVHQAAARVVRRHTEPLAQSLRLLGQSVYDALDEVVRVFEMQRGADERQLNEVVANVYDRISVLDAVVEAVADLERRVGELEHAARR